jgi:DNA-damage-inducible protein J
MKTEILTTRIDHDTKLAFTHICDEVGLSPSQAIKLFAKAVINYGGIPFELKAKQPNADTLAAIQELEQGKGHKATDINQLFNELTDSKVSHV